MHLPRKFSIAKVLSNREILSEIESAAIAPSSSSVRKKRQRIICSDDESDSGGTSSKCVDTVGNEKGNEPTGSVVNKYYFKFG